MVKTIYNPSYRQLVAQLSAARRQAGITQETAGAKLGLSRQWLNKTERCQIRLDVVQVCRVARLYGLKAHDLVRRMEKELSEGDDPFYVSATLIIHAGDEPTIRRMITAFSTSLNGRPSSILKTSAKVLAAGALEDRVQA